MPGGRALFHHSNYPKAAETHYGVNPHSRNRMTVAALPGIRTRPLGWRRRRPS